ncbi:MAG: AAA family ATPase [Dysgonamonadaceae bacterium]|jgi:DNA replication ATP-dependent helicase Dna2|nr:AAA family ATPase [Dysgonamonadaceae bacterium]
MPDYPFYIAEIETISQTGQSPRDKLFLLKQLLERICKELTRYEALQFPNLFSRIVFVAQKFGLSKQSEWQLQNLRVKSRELRKKPKKYFGESEYAKSQKAVEALCRAASGERPETEENLVAEAVALPEANKLRVQIKAIDSDNRLLHCIAENPAGLEIAVKYGVSPENKEFDTSAQRFWVGAQLNLIDCMADKNGFLVPRFLVLEPDYLIDASAIAECFQDYAVSPLHYFRNKFEEKENRSYILLGNLANFFLDELIFAENPDEVSFEDAFLRSFKQSPFEYTSCADIRSEHDFRDFMGKARLQFENIRRVIKKDFPKQNIDVHQCTLEPSFFSEKFGFQGRLDLLQTTADKSGFNIVELKSGRLPYPAYDKGKIALNHEVQTAVYRLMIESVSGKASRNIHAAILYSSGENAGENLRFAAVYHELEKKIVNLRNLVVANEYALTYGGNQLVENFLQSLSETDLSARLPDFFRQRIEAFDAVLKQCSPLERSYFFRHIRFISRELYLQKIGDTAYESPTGVASLWNSDFSERAEALELLFDLTIEEIIDSDNRMTLVFKRNRTENDIVNFREGEICIVYPRQSENDTVLNTQILKGNIAKIDAERVEVHFRYRQKNKAFFSENRLWAIEHDTLDSSYNNLYKSLFAFLKSPREKRNLLLGLRPPESGSTVRKAPNPQEEIIQKALSAKDYFLIVGPPGTGKTSIFARRLIEEYHAKPENNIMVLAYTNRAVDELCEAINAAFGCSDGSCEQFIRVGTELSCAVPFRHRLLQRISEQSPNREALRREIDKTRIVIATLASINGRKELFDLKHFNIAVIDEASQILESQIIGLLPKFDSFVMIGDHNQLSTIVLQKPSLSRISEEELLSAGFGDCGDSLFERLLQTCTKNAWTQAFAQLTRQGRMHEEIAAFPSKHFYGGNLFAANDWQHAPIQLPLPDSDENPLHRLVAQNRMLFFSTEKQPFTSHSDKINDAEADLIVSLTKAVIGIYQSAGEAFDTGRIGIIAPYRNQIACIRHALSKAEVPGAEHILVDTVERFQGSQRDIILISFCVNKAYQLDFLCNLNADGTVDRKLNVALTRARQQLFMTGNAQVLRKHPVYAELLNFLEKNKVYNLVIDR